MADNDFSWTNQPGLHRWDRRHIDRGTHFDEGEGQAHYGFGHHHDHDEQRRRHWVARDRDWREDEYDRRRMTGGALQGIARGFDDWWDRARDKVSSWVGSDRDRGPEGPHRGKGPRGYVRSAERIQEDVYDRLSYDPRIDASNVDIRVEGSEVVLSGTVRSREEKYRAEDLVESISGVSSVQNNLRVEKDMGHGPHLTRDHKIW
ncbi:MAG TPA: BON domain-containing protein [Chitinophagaceae bacterium]